VRIGISLWNSCTDPGQPCEINSGAAPALSFLADVVQVDSGEPDLVLLKRLIPASCSRSRSDRASIPQRFQVRQIRSVLPVVPAFVGQRTCGETRLEIGEHIVADMQPERVGQRSCLYRRATVLC